LNATAVSSFKINLAWKDNSTNETSFVVGRGSSSNGPFADIITLAANSTNYSNTNLTPSTTYYYVVRAVNVQGSSSNSAPASATTADAAPTPPVIDVAPQNQTVPIGQSATFVVSASGTQPLSYQWRFNGNNLPGATSTSYTILSASNSLNGPYSVFVSNSLGSTSSPSALLTVVSLVTFGDDSLGQASPSLQATNVVALAAGAWHSLALQVSGKVAGWGNNANGQCVAPQDLTNAIAIAAGGYHNLAINANGSVAAWGANSYGQTALPAGLSDVIAVAAGTWHSVALRRDGTLAVWGDDSWGQTDLPPGLTNVTAIAAGGNHTLALKADGTVAAWGENTDGEGFYAGQSAVPPGLTNVVGIAAGFYHSLAVKADGTVVTWGDNSQGQCTVPAGLGRVIALAGGGRHSLALESDGTVVAWGDNGQGQCGIPNGFTNAIAVSAGDSHTLVLFDDGSLTPQLLSAAWSGNRFSAVAQTLNRKNYSLEAKTSIQATNWSAVSNVPGNGALKLLNDSSATSAQRFYRVRQW
jgi:alpha-tubulin suppressor-like RCC1 family protein